MVDDWRIIMARAKHDRKITFVVIPDANSSVVRFRITKRTLIGTLSCSLILIAAITASAIYLYYMRGENMRLAEQLKEQLTESTATVASQDETISSLQQHVIDLSNQSEEIRSKLERMKALEQSLKGLSGMTNPTDVPNSSFGDIAMHALTEEDTPQDSLLGVGGSFNEVSSEEMIQLSKKTQSLLTDLGHEFDELEISFVEAKQQAEERQLELAMTPTIWPTDSKRITSGFGYRKDPFSRRASFHSGLDISADMNTPVLATADGVVSFTGFDAAHGRNVIINHTKGIQTRYLHLNKILVGDGDTVKKGQQIALSGNTGRSTGPHLHYEVIKNGVVIDPKPYLED